jgi:hypothetical protein
MAEDRAAYVQTHQAQAAPPFVCPHVGKRLPSASVKLTEQVD